jgi:drug/metabolite transporter (DMT)-like permease
VKAKIAAAFFAIYFIWGSTYLAIRFGVETIPPVLLTSLRFFAAGGLILGLSWAVREGKLGPRERKIAIGSGILLISANAFVCIAELTVPSGLAAVVIGSIPIWIMLLSWAFFGGARPTWLKIGGALIGVGGVSLIALESQNMSGGGFFPFFLLSLSCAFWCTGTLMQKNLKGLKSPFAFSAWQMLSGAAVAGAWSLARGDLSAVQWAAVSAPSWLALAYLTVFGSVVAFSAYNWLSREVEPHYVSTYALVNPVIAVALGIVFYGEKASTQFFLASTLVVAGLALMMWRPKRA